jgi:hypothetical protein
VNDPQRGEVWLVDLGLAAKVFLYGSHPVLLYLPCGRVAQWIEHLPSIRSACGEMNPYAGRCGMLETLRGNQQATPPDAKIVKRGVLRDYEQRGCDAEDIVQPPRKRGIGC